MSLEISPKDVPGCPFYLEFNKLEQGLPTIFFDRDQTITVDKGYSYKLEEFALTKNFSKLIPFINTLNLNIVVLTNQGGVKLGKFTAAESLNFNLHLQKELSKINLSLNVIMSCYHHDSDLCHYRKPEPGMMEFVIDKYRLTKGKCLMVGDSSSDEMLAIANGVFFINIEDLHSVSLLSNWISKEKEIT